MSPAVPLGRVLALVGGLALVSAYFMPWFGIQVGNQGVTLSGQFLGRLLSTTNDLRRLMPGARGGPEEVRNLLLLVYLFPSTGALGALVAIATAFVSRRGLWNILLAVLGLVPLVALIGGLSQLPPGSTMEAGLWTIGIGAVLVVLGALLDALLVRRAPV